MKRVGFTSEGAPVLVPCPERGEGVCNRASWGKVPVKFVSTFVNFGYARKGRTSVPLLSAQNDGVEDSVVCPGGALHGKDF